MIKAEIVAHSVNPQGPDRKAMYHEPTKWVGYIKTQNPCKFQGDKSYGRRYRTTQT